MTSSLAQLIALDVDGIGGRFIVEYGERREQRRQSLITKSAKAVSPARGNVGGPWPQPHTCERGAGDMRVEGPLIDGAIAAIGRPGDTGRPAIWPLAVRAGIVRSIPERNVAAGEGHLDSRFPAAPGSPKVGTASAAADVPDWSQRRMRAFFVVSTPATVLFKVTCSVAWLMLCIW